jgi:hypothetical protein
VVVGIARQDQAMAQGLCILGLRLCHARRVPRIVHEFRRWSIRENLSCKKPARNRTVECPGHATDLACWAVRGQILHELHERKKTPPSCGG